MRPWRARAAAVWCGGWLAALAAATGAVALPEIRTSERNRVPACVTPERLQRFLADGNDELLPKFRTIARHYKEHGERLGVRWDYAFFQMIVETNYLKFRNNSGAGDVSPKQNNFAGIGTTGGGVPGDSFPDVSTGVLAQMQHLVAYSGERVARPVAHRTREKQDEIVAKSLALGRPPTFRDLAGRWASDRRYGRTIESVASRFRQAYCSGPEPPPAPEVTARAAGGPPARQTSSGPEGKRGRAAASTGGTAAERPAMTASTAAAGTRLGSAREPTSRRAEADTASDRRAEPAMPCAVLTASYGGQRNVLIRAEAAGEMQYTALQVLDGQEQRLARAFIRSHAAGGETIGEFASREAALARAFELCPAARAAQ
jgi:hypothetical protein